MNEILKRVSPPLEPIYIPLCGVTLRDSNYKHYRYDSAVTALEFVYAGEGWIEKDGEIITITENTVYLLCAGCEHNYGANPDNPWEKIFINVGGKLASQLPAKFGLDKIGVYSGDGMFDLFSRIRTIAKSQPQENDMATLIGFFTEALFRLSQNTKLAKHSVEALQMKFLLDSSTNRLVSNDELAKHIFRSKDYCIKHFSAEFGVTPYEYQLSTKMDIVCTELETSTLPICRIAESVGYHDPQYFCNLFKKRIGLSPKEYRNLKKNLSKA